MEITRFKLLIGAVVILFVLTAINAMNIAGMQGRVEWLKEHINDDYETVSALLESYYWHTHREDGYRSNIRDEFIEELRRRGIE